MEWISQSHYISNCRKQFSTYLCRPDHKQEFISQWQEYYNGLDVSLRHEEVMKAELHHRVDVSEILRRLQYLVPSTCFFYLFISYVGSD